MINAVAFDAFGTLLKITDLQYPYLKFLSETGAGARFDYNKLLIQKFISTRDVANEIGCFDDEQIATLEQGIKREVDSTELYPETIDVLVALRQAGLKLALISNLSFEYQEPIARLGLESYFDVIKYSFLAGCRKPDQQIFKQVAEDLGVNASDILMIGDSYKSDFTGACAAGLSALLLDRMQRRLDVHERVDDLLGVKVYLKLE